MSAATDQIDAMVNGLWQAISMQQSQHIATNDVYCQVPWTHSSPPSSLVAQDSLSSAPPVALGWLPAKMRCRLSVDTYGKPDGWTLRLEASVSGVVWQKFIDCNGTGSAWEQV
jgi:hypothetical protein